jgi:hypothetical protein
MNANMNTPSLEVERRDHTIKAIARLIGSRCDPTGDAALDDLRGLIGYMGWSPTELEATLRYVLIEAVAARSDDTEGAG